ncbi:MAG TPA: endo-1,4-beta-xylanase [Opitutaceae bacterium]|nr:endo-1,4-beta-xylanase [Opitutaceae bacterium]
MRLQILFLSIISSCLAAQPEPSLCQTYQNDFLIGVALHSHYSPAEKTLLVHNFNALTPENCMKPEATHPSEAQWTFEDGDDLVKLAVENHLQFFGHNLVWHNQTPNWFFLDGEKSASRDLVIARLKNHIQTLVTRYRGKIRGWDVVNEAISDKKDEYLRPTKWLAALGEDYLVLAYRFAHEADPRAELQYNDYSIEEPVKRAKAVRLIKALQAAGVPIASVGIQGHWSLDKVPFADVEASILAFRELGVKVAITELDLDVIPRKVIGAEASAHEQSNNELVKSTPLSPEMAQRQAEQYAQLFRLFLRYKTDIVRITFWGLDDGRSWLNTWPVKRYNHPLLFDRNLKPKPAFFAVLKAHDSEK